MKKIECEELARRNALNIITIENDKISLDLQKVTKVNDKKLQKKMINYIS
jgi:hypothetical protein